jgi:xanthine dehydrogenase small subunit
MTTFHSINIPIFIDGKHSNLACAHACQSLLHSLNQNGYSGTKEGCGDGDCGACTVVQLITDKDGVVKPVAVNSCLIPTEALRNQSIITVEGVAQTWSQPALLHPVQQAMVDCAGSQCGYCTPGFVMSMFADFHDHKLLNEEVVEGNLCRCTGYSSIRRAMARLKDVPSFALPSPVVEGNSSDDVEVFRRPQSVSAALHLKSTLPNARWLAGATDIGLELSRNPASGGIFIALDHLPELQRIQVTPTSVELGAAVRLSVLKEALEADLGASEWRALRTMLHWFAAKQVRNRATIGGNIGTASPIGDLLPVLLTLDAELQLRNLSGERWVKLSDYFLSYRKTFLQADELICSVRIARPAAGLQRLTNSFKVGKRGSDDISIVAASYVLDIDDNACIRHARLAYGGVAGIPLRATEAEALLIGRDLSKADSLDVVSALGNAFQPLSDFRGSADYRRQLIVNLYRKFLSECRA